MKERDITWIHTWRRRSGSPILSAVVATTREDLNIITVEWKNYRNLYENLSTHNIMKGLGLIGKRKGIGSRGSRISRGYTVSLSEKKDRKRNEKTERFHDRRSNDGFLYVIPTFCTHNIRQNVRFITPSLHFYKFSRQHSSIRKRMTLLFQKKNLSDHLPSFAFGGKNNLEIWRIIRFYSPLSRAGQNRIFSINFLTICRGKGNRRDGES